MYIKTNLGHMTKMAIMPIYSKNTQLLFFCPVTVLVDPKVSDCCPLGYFLIIFIILLKTYIVGTHQNLFREVVLDH